MSEVPLYWVALAMQEQFFFARAVYYPHHPPPLQLDTLYRLAWAMRSSSSFFLMAYELDEPFAHKKKDPLARNLQ